MGTMLSLKEAANLRSLQVVRSSDFATLGFLQDRLPQMLTFVESPKYLDHLRSNRMVSCVIATGEIASRIPSDLGLAISVTPRRDFFELHNALVEQTDLYGAEFPTEIDPTARIHPRAIVAASRVRIGAGTVIDANVVVSEGCRIGARVRVHPGAVLGGAGFQTYRGADCVIEMAHAGGLEIGDGVHVFSQAVIARGVFRQSTRIDRNCRIGNGAFVSHNTEIGEQSLIGHGAVVNGNCRLGSRVWIGPGAVLSNLISIGDDAKVSLGAVVIRDVAAGVHLSGNFAVSHERLLRQVAATEWGGADASTDHKQRAG